jgi:hypothetical protein
MGSGTAEGADEVEVPARTVGEVAMMTDESATWLPENNAPH